MCVFTIGGVSPSSKPPPPELQLTVGLQEKRERNVTELQMIEDVF